MSTTINPTTPSAHRIHRDGTSGDLVLTTPAYRPRLVGHTPEPARRPGADDHYRYASRGF